MFENEGTEIESTSDVSTETPSESQSDAQAGQGSGQETQNSAPKQEEEQRIPYDRFQEMVAHKNEAIAKMQAYEQRMAQMERQLQESSKPKENRPDFNEIRSKMSERFKGIDPETQAYFSALEEQAISAKQELAQFREEQFVNRAVSRFEELNKANGVPPELAGAYRAQLDEAYRKGKIRSLEDLETAYKSVHEPLNKYLQSREKASIEKYTTEKKKTAAQPATQPKGKAASPGQAPKSFANQQDRRQALIKEAVTQLRASKEV